MGTDVGKKAYLFMNDLKLFGKSEEKKDSLTNRVQRCGRDINMEFGIIECSVLNMKRENKEASRGL